MKIWQCKIGESSSFPKGADLLMREAVSKTYTEITGQEPDFIFSGWGAELTEPERAVVENRLPNGPQETKDNQKIALTKAINALGIDAMCNKADHVLSDEILNYMKSQKYNHYL